MDVTAIAVMVVNLGSNHEHVLLVRVSTFLHVEKQKGYHEAFYAIGYGNYSASIAQLWKRRQVLLL